MNPDNCPPLQVDIVGPVGAPWLTLSHSLATDMRSWEPQLKALSAHFRVLRYDARGHGRSGVPNGPYVMQDLVDDVIRLWDQHRIQQSHFVGLSMGGMTGIGLALHAPSRLGKLIACNCRLDAPQMFRDMWDTRIQTIHDSGMAGVAELTLDTWFTKTTVASGGAMLEQVRKMILETPQAGYIACAEALKKLDYKRSLGRLRVPTQFLVGDEDGIHPDEMASIARQASKSALIVLDNAAHLSNMEQPTAFNRAVLEFLLSSDDEPLSDV